MDVSWIKIQTEMFNNKKIKYIRKYIPEGNEIVLIWVMILCSAGKCNDKGRVFLFDGIPYNEKFLSDEYEFPEHTISLALKTLEKFKMIEIDEDNYIQINNWEEYQNVDGMEKIREQTRKRVEKHRKRKEMENNDIKQLPCNVTTNVTCNNNVTHSNATEVELDLELDLDLDSSSSTNLTATKTMIDFFNKHYTGFYGHNAEMINSYIDDGMSETVVLEALKEGVEAGANNMKYVKTILNSWVNSKVFTIDDLAIYRAKFRNRKQLVKENSTTCIEKSEEERLNEFRKRQGRL